MAIPDFESIMLPLLEFLKDKKIHSMSDALKSLTKHFELTEDEKKTLKASGGETLFNNRLFWARFYLKKAGLVTDPKRAHVIITEKGSETLEKKPKQINIEFLLQFPSFVKFYSKKKIAEEPKAKKIVATTFSVGILVGIITILITLTISYFPIFNILDITDDTKEEEIRNLIEKLEDKENQIFKIKDMVIINKVRNDYIAPNDKLLLKINYVNKKEYEIKVESEIIVKFKGEEDARYKNFGPFPIEPNDISPQEFEFFAGPAGFNEITLLNNVSNETQILSHYSLKTNHDFEVHLIDTRLLEQSNKNSNTALFVSTFIGGITALALLSHVWTSRQQVTQLKEQNKLTSLIQVFNLLSDEGHRQSREQVYLAFRLYKTSKNLNVYQTPNIRTGVLRVRSEFDQVGAFVQNNLVPKKSFMDVYANTVILCWYALKDHIYDERKKRNYSNYMAYFEWLADEAKTYWQKRYPEEPLPEPI